MRYRKINIVLDEAEICFHPEMQRRFVENLVTYISGTGLTRYLSFNLFIITHSPFILSDIPKSNILYLSEDGIPSQEKIINPFGANVNDVLAQSFFLKKGYIGEFAKTIIESLAEYLTHGKDHHRKKWDMTYAKKMIDSIEEPYIHRALSRLYYQNNEENPN